MIKTRTVKTPVKKVAYEVLDDAPSYDLFDAGYDAFGQNNLTFTGIEENRKTPSYFDAGVPSNFIQDGDVITRLNVVDGYLQSDGFVSGETGWRIDSDGNAEFEDGYFRGDISGATGTFTGTVPSDDTKLDSTGGAYKSAEEGARVSIFPDSNTGIKVIDDTSTDVFKAEVGGENVGDVTIGNFEGGQGIKYDKSENTTTFNGYVKNGTGVTLIDETGLNSVNNFLFDNYYATASTSTSSTNFVDISGSELTFTLERSANVFVIFSARIFVTGANLGGEVYINIDGTNYGPGLYEPEAASSAASHTMETLDAGRHTIKIQYRVGDADCTLTITERRLSYIILGA